MYLGLLRLVANRGHLLLLGGSLLATDQILKWYIRSRAVQENIFGFIKLEAVHNTGSIFSLPLPGFLSVAGGIIALAALAYWYTGASYITKQIAIIGLMSGGVSNLGDRIFHEAVIDIFTLGSLTFNLADCLILGSVALYITKLTSKNWVK